MKVNRICETVDYIITRILMPVFILINLITGCLVVCGKVEMTRMASGIALWIIALALFVLWDMENQRRRRRERMS